MELFYSSGLRLAELTGLELRDLDLKPAQVRVLGKGGKERIVPVGRMAVKALEALARSAHGWRAQDQQAVFVGRATARRLGRARCSCASATGRAPRVCRSTCTRTCSGIPLRPICLNPVVICVVCRSCSGTPTSAPPRSIPTLISSISPAHTTGPPACQTPRLSQTPMSKAFDPHSTTILAVRRDGAIVLGGDGQVTLGNTVMKGNARKVRRLSNGKVLAGFAGGTADAFTLFERFEGKLEKYGNLTRAAIELAKDWRSDRYLRRLEALLLVGDPRTCSSSRATAT